MSEKQQPSIEQRTLEVHMTYMQFSKKIAIASVVSWAITVLCAMGYIVFIPADVLTADLVKTIAGYSATLTGTVVVAYMGNSGLEKYARYKYDFEAAKRDMGGASTLPITTYTTGPGKG